jgi:hypothetical protein
MDIGVYCYLLLFFSYIITIKTCRWRKTDSYNELIIDTTSTGNLNT